MITMKKIAVGLIALACAGSIQAKVTKDYVVYVQPQNANGDFVDMIASIDGWTCSSSINSTFSSVQLDSKGLAKRITRDNSWGHRYDNFWQGQPSLRMNFEHNANNTNPAISISMTERCQKTEYEYQLVTKYDDEGNSYQEMERVEIVKSIHKSWSCNLPENIFPQRNGGVHEGICNTSSSSYHDFDLNSMLLSRLKEKVIHFALKYNGAQESFINLNTPEHIAGGDAERFVFNVSQGLSGGAFENDFSIFMKVNGQTKEIQTSNGLLNEDFVMYVPKGDDHVSIEFSGVEADLFSDDQYNAMSSIKLYKNSKSDRIVTLTSDGMIGEGDRSMIRVKLIEGPEVKFNPSVAAKVSERMQEEISKQKSLVVAQMENIENIRRELLKAESNYDLAKTISIPVSVVGAGLVAFGAYNMWTGDGIDTKEIVMAGTGGVMIAASATSIILTKSQVTRLLDKLREVEANFQLALEKLEAKQLKLEEAELKIASSENY